MVVQGTERVKRLELWVGLAVSFILGALSLLRADVPNFAVVLLLAGGSIFAWLIWNSTSEWRRLLRAVVVVGVLSISVYVSRKVYPSRNTSILRRNNTEVRSTVPVSDYPPPTPSKRPVSQDVTVVMYNDANDPQFSLDGKPVQPTRYSSGIATFRLQSGTHLVHAEYSTRICSASVTVPLQEAGPISANCSLKRVGGA